MPALPARRLLTGIALSALLAAGTLVGMAPAPAAPTYTPVGECNIPIVMSDGVTIRANVTHPAEKGRYPTVISITGYNKDAGGYGGRCSPGDTDLVSQGYASMSVDDRGTGASEGRWDRYGPRTRKDYGEILDWIQDQRWSNGKVGTTGTSYAAGTAIMIAIEDAKRVAAGKPRAVEAVWADLIMSDMYRDYPHVGGFVNLAFTAPWLGIVGGTSAPPPTTLGYDNDALKTWADHWTNVKDMHVPLTAGALAGGDKAYDSNWYRSHSPGTGAELVDIPVAWTGGWFDIFQRGEFEYWHLLERAPVKKMWMNPIYHVGGSNYFNDQDIGSKGEVVQKWWDHWLKDRANGVEDLPNVNLWVMGRDRWYHGDDWPAVRYTPFYLDGGSSGSADSMNDGLLGLRTGKPGSDWMPFHPGQGACSRSPAHWGFGVTACEKDHRGDEAWALTYSTKPLRDSVTIAGRVTADVWAEVTSPDTAFVVRLEDVAPDGSATEITGGWLIGRFRGLDQGRTLRGPGGVVIRPFHPFTKGSERLLTAGIPTRFLIEVYPTMHMFRKGHRIRVAITTSDYPAMGIPEPWQRDMLGGEIRLLRGREYGSNILLPVVR